MVRPLDESQGSSPLQGHGSWLMCEVALIAIEKKERINNSFFSIYVADTVDKKCEDVAATQVLRKERTSIKRAHNGHPEGEEQSSPVLRSRIERVCQAEQVHIHHVGEVDSNCNTSISFCC